MCALSDHSVWSKDLFKPLAFPVELFSQVSKDNFDMDNCMDICADVRGKSSVLWTDDDVSDVAIDASLRLRGSFRLS